MNRPYEPLAQDEAEGLVTPNWADQNQRWLARRFAQLAQCLQAADAPCAGPGSEEPLQRGFEPAHRRLVRLFGLSAFEGELLLLAAGAECDVALRQAIAHAEGLAAAPQAGVSFALALARLPDAHWDAMSPLAPLRHWQLLRVNADAGLGQARLRIDERVLHHLTGVAAFDERLAGVARLWDTGPATLHETAPAEAGELAEALARALAEHARPLALLNLPPHQPRARRAARTLVLQALRHLPLHALWVDCGALDADAAALAETARALDREAALSGAAVVLGGMPHGGPAAEAGEAGATVLRLLQQLRSPVVVLGPVSAAELAELPERHCWRCSVPAVPPAWPEAPGLRRALQQFQVDEHSLEQALAGLPEAGPENQEAALWQALRQASRGGLDALAQRIESPARLQDLVLPAAALDTLKSITLQLRHRARVHEDWGFATPGGRGLGLAALFAGESGTGKTYAAEAIANEAGLDLYRVDLALTVSKYIGETEKNLRRLFDAAESSGAVLLFDEADALFGKRSDVKDSHDRYANIEVSYLLQRMESYRGLAVLTTNLKSALDRAFLRRLRFVVNFPFPDEAAREALWRRQFPAQAPLDADVDWRALARLHLTGGHIHAVALNGAFRAAAEGGAIAQRHLIDAARAEYLKLERSFGTAGAAP
jgi:hypothetical protein